MKKLNLTQMALVSALVAMGAVSCTPSENTNTTTTTTVTATPSPTPDTNAIVAEITKLENDFPRIIREKDGAALRRLEADDLMSVYPDGNAGNKEQDVKDIEAGLMTFDSWDLSNMKVNVIDSDTAVATFLITVANGKIKSPDGKATQNISGKYRVIDTFVRRNGQWQLVASGITPLSPAAAAAAAASASPQASPGATASRATKASPAPRVSPTRRPPPPPVSTP
ncbi:MAG TPA: nuclear transport factor 2 family protein [Pyrinomonadaceae bacterium]|nr:nuclear transport factor 2 family protein [Pyrinomonadaceae bacterium]